MKRLLDYDPFTGLMTFHDYDETEDKTFISYEQDVEPILERNKRAQNEATGRMGDMVHVASIPSSIQLKWLIEHGVDITNKDHMPRVARLLNSSEYRYLKVRDIII
jgi:hypothetical protein